MELRHYASIIGRRKWVVLLTVLIALGIALAASFLIPPTYAAATTLRIATTTSGRVLDQRYDIEYADRLMNTYTKIATSGPVLSQLAQKLGTSRPPPVSVEVPANTELMKLTVEDRDPGRAAIAANLLAKIVIDDFQTHYAQTGQSAQETLSSRLNQAAIDLEQARQKYDATVAQAPQDQPRITAARVELDRQQQLYNELLTQYEQARLLSTTATNTIAVVDPALPPISPARPNVPLNLALGLIVGLVGGVGLAFFFENLDTTLFTTEQIEEAAGSRVVGRIPTLQMGRGSRLNNHVPVEEAFLRLRTNLSQLDHGEGVPHTLLVTSAQAGEGKSTIAVNLARALAQSGRSVILVDADLRAPVLHRVFNLPNSKGLSTVLQRKTTLDEAIQHSKIPRVFVLTSGPLTASPGELLGSSEVKSLMQQLANLFGVVVLDSPPFLPVTDAAALAPIVDGVLLVIARGQSRREVVQEASDQIANLGVRSLGVVMNRADHDPFYDSYYSRPVESADQAGARRRSR